MAIGVMKALVNNAYSQDRDASLRDEATGCEMNSRSADFAEGLRAFVDRRDPKWTGL